MIAIRRLYERLPKRIAIPDTMRDRKVEVIFLELDATKAPPSKRLEDFFGSLPDFPDRSPQGEYEERAVL